MKPPVGKAAVLVNVTAGRGRGALAAARAARYMRQVGWQVIGPASTPAGAAERQALIVKLARRADRLVVVGGDGTLRETGAALYAHVPMTVIGLIPTGNSNVLARDLNIPLNPLQAMHLVTTGQARTVDAALVTPADASLEPQFFLAMLDIGFGAAVIHHVHRWRRRWQHAYRLGSDLLYLMAGAMAVQQPRQPAFDIRIDGQPPVPQCRLAVIANASTYAKGWSLTPDALPTDGILDVFGQQRDNHTAIVRSYFNAWRRRMTRKRYIHYGRGRQMKITGEQPLCLQVDGDPLAPQNRLQIEILPGAVRIMAPPPSNTVI